MNYRKNGKKEENTRGRLDHLLANFVNRGIEQFDNHNGLGGKLHTMMNPGVKKYATQVIGKKRVPETILQVVENLFEHYGGKISTPKGP